MAIYHLHAQVISRKAGRSTTAASAYRAGARIVDARTGVTHDYTRKKGVVASALFLPDHAPSEWCDREALWNAVEKSAKKSNARLAREFDVALPRELPREDQWMLAERFALSLADQGMCCDVAMHDKGDGNPHFHCMATMRPCDGRGFLPTSRQLYLVRKPGEADRLVPAEGVTDGWEKVYVYKDGKKRTFSEAEAEGLDPKADRKRRQPVSKREALDTGWDSVEQLEAWREGWEALANEALREAGRAERVDHRSNEARGLDTRPTIHEGATVRAVERCARDRAERAGERYEPVTDRARENAAARAAAPLDRVRAAVERVEVARIEAERDASIRAIEEKTTARVAAILDERRGAPYLVPRFVDEVVRSDLEAVARCLAAAPESLPQVDAEEVAAALAATPGRGRVDPVRAAAGDAMVAVNETYGEYYDERDQGSLPDLMHLLLLAAERLRSLLARLVVLMEAAREEARLRGEEKAADDAAEWALEREAKRRQALVQAARDAVGNPRRPMADEPGMRDAVPPLDVQG
jgi:hypothetical protein